MATSSVAAEHTVYVSGELPPGEYEYFVTGANPAGLTTVDDNEGIYYPLEVGELRITSDGFMETTTGIPAMQTVNGISDFDGDGKPEIIGMVISDSQYDEVRIYEKTESGGYDAVFASDMDYFPWDIGDTDRDGLFEILGNRRGVTFLYESPTAGAYPTKRIWEMEGIWGGQIADMDSDGQKEIVAPRLDTRHIIV